MPLSARILANLYLLACLATFLYLTFFDGFDYTAWNWLIKIPVNLACAATWPAYWPIRGALELL